MKVGKQGKKDAGKLYVRDVVSNAGYNITQGIPLDLSGKQAGVHMRFVFLGLSRQTPCQIQFVRLTAHRPS